jgi:hypothetical protein
VESLKRTTEALFSHDTSEETAKHDDQILWLRALRPLKGCKVSVIELVERHAAYGSSTSIARSFPAIRGCALVSDGPGLHRAATQRCHAISGEIAQAEKAVAPTLEVRDSDTPRLDIGQVIEGLRFAAHGRKNRRVRIWDRRRRTTDDGAALAGAGPSSV